MQTFGGLSNPKAILFSKQLYSFKQVFQFKNYYHLFAYSFMVLNILSYTNNFQTDLFVP